MLDVAIKTALFRHTSHRVCKQPSLLLARHTCIVGSFSREKAKYVYIRFSVDGDSLECEAGSRPNKIERERERETDKERVREHKEGGYFCRLLQTTEEMRSSSSVGGDVFSLFAY